GACEGSRFHDRSSFLCLSFRFRRHLVKTTIDAHCQRRAERERESARALRRRARVHRFRQLLSDPRRSDARAATNALAITRALAEMRGPAHCRTKRGRCDEAASDRRPTKMEHEMKRTGNLLLAGSALSGAVALVASCRGATPAQAQTAPPPPAVSVAAVE